MGCGSGYRFFLSENERLKISFLFLPCQSYTDGSGAGRRQPYFFRYREKSGKLDLLIAAEVGWEAK